MFYARLLVIIAVMYFYSFAQQPLNNLIPASRIVDWHNVGVEGGIPRYVSHEINFQTLKNANPGLNDYQVFTDVALVQARTYKQTYPAARVSIYFPAGSYTLSWGLVSAFQFSLQDSNLIIRGAGSNNTTLNFTVNVGNLINVSGSISSSYYNLDPVQGFSKGNKIIKTINPINSVNNGDYIELVESNGPWIGNYAGGSGSPPTDVVGQIVRVKTISQNKTVIELYDELRIDYHSYLNPRIRRIEPIRNIGFEDFRINSLSTTTANGGPSNFSFSYAVNCWVSGVDSYNACSAHVGIGNSSHIEVRGCYFHDATTYGEGGHGYGVSIGTHSTNCLVENNIFAHLRHAMIIARGANGNVFGYNHSRDQVDDLIVNLADINIHGHYAFANLFEGNDAIFAMADNHWGNNGPYNTFFRNYFQADVILEFADYTNALGNEFYGQHGINYNGDPIFPYDGSDPQTQFDLYGLFNDGGSGYGWPTHAQASVAGPLMLNYCFINDASYYRTQRPSFMGSPSAYSWPPMGPGFDYNPTTHFRWLTGQTIPALDRWYEPIKTVVSEPSIFPLPPIATSATNVTSTSFTANWQVWAGATNYRLDVSISSNFSSFVSGYNNLSVGNVTSKSVTGLSSGVQYWYRVRAENSTGVSPNSNVIGLLKVTMSGPTTVYHADPKQTPPNCYTWTASATGGVPPYSYVWSWPAYGTNSSYSECFSWNGYSGGSYQFTYRVDVTDAQNSTAFATKTVTANNSGGGPTPKIEGQGEIVSVIPKEFGLSQNYPNPFNPDTEISFALPEVSTVKLTVIDVLGRAVLTLQDGQMSPGYHRVKWAGLNASGEQVGTGIYFYRLHAIGESGKEYIKTAKMLLAK